MLLAFLLAALLLATPSSASIWVQPSDNANSATCGMSFQSPCGSLRQALDVAAARFSGEVTLQFMLLGGLFSGPSNCNVSLDMSIFPPSDDTWHVPRGAPSTRPSIILKGNKMFFGGGDTVFECGALPVLAPFDVLRGPRALAVHDLTVRNSGPLAAISYDQDYWTPRTDDGRPLFPVPSMSVSLDGCVFSGLTALGSSAASSAGAGGDLRAEDGGVLRVDIPGSVSFVSLSECHVANCSAARGGVVAMNAGARGTLTIDKSRLEGNRAVGIDGDYQAVVAGGAVLMRYASLIVTDSHFEGNEASSSSSIEQTSAVGGAVAMFSPFSAMVRRSVFRNNKARAGGPCVGGAIGEWRSEGHVPSSVQDSDCTAENLCPGVGNPAVADFKRGLISSVFEHNLVLGKAPTMGGHVFGAMCTIHNCTFSDGLAYTGGAITQCGGPSEILNSRFERNQAIMFSGAIHGAEGIINDTAFRGNKALRDCGAVSSWARILFHNATSDSNDARLGHGGFLCLLKDGVATILHSTVVLTRARYGGVVYLSESASLTVHGGRYENNTASSWGGVLYAEDLAVAFLGRGAQFVGNVAKEGGLAKMDTLSLLTVGEMTAIRHSADFGALFFVAAINKFMRVRRQCPLLLSDQVRANDDLLRTSDNTAAIGGNWIYLSSQDSRLGFHCFGSLRRMLMRVFGLDRQELESLNVLAAAPSGLVLVRPYSQEASPQEMLNATFQFTDQFGHYITRKRDLRHSVVFSMDASDDGVVVGQTSPTFEAVPASGLLELSGFRLLGDPGTVYNVTVTATSSPVLDDDSANIAVQMSTTCGPGFQFVVFSSPISGATVNEDGDEDEDAPRVLDCRQCQNGTFNFAGGHRCFSCDTTEVTCMGATVLTRDGYWLKPLPDTEATSPEELDAYQLEVYRCSPSSHCRDGNECADHRDPTSPLCGACVPGYYSWGNACVECKYSVNYLLLAGLALAGWAFVLLQHFYLTNHAGSLSSIFFFFVQMAPLVAADYSSGAVYLFSFRFESPVCVARFDYYEQLIFQLCLPLSLFVMLGITYVLERMCAHSWASNLLTSGRGNESWLAGCCTYQSAPEQRWHKVFSDEAEAGAAYVPLAPSDEAETQDAAAPSDSDSESNEAWLGRIRNLQYLRTLLNLVILGYSSVALLTMQFLRCSDVAGKSVVSSAPSVECGTDRYNRYLGFNIAVLVVTAVGVNVGMLWLFLRNSDTVQAVLDVVYCKYDAHNRFYEVVIQLRKTAIIVVFAVLEREPLPASWTICVLCLAMFCLHIYRKPFATASQNALETWSLLSLFMLATIRAAVESSRKDHKRPDSESDTHIIIQVTIASFIAVFVGMVAQHLYSKVQDKQQRRLRARGVTPFASSAVSFDGVMEMSRKDSGI